MSLHGMLRGQMVRVHGDKEYTTRKGEKGIYVDFTVAGRDKRINNKGEKETDFYFCRAFGAQAEIILKYFNNTDETGKIIKGKSRKIDLMGEMQSYKAIREESQTAKITAKKIFDYLKIGSQGEKDKKKIPVNYNMKIEVTEWVFKVDKVFFVDYDKDDDEADVIGDIDIDENIEGPLTVDDNDDYDDCENTSKKGINSKKKGRNSKSFDDIMENNDNGNGNTLKVINDALGIINPLS